MLIAVADSIPHWVYGNIIHPVYILSRLQIMEIIVEKIYHYYPPKLINIDSFMLHHQFFFPEWPIKTHLHTLLWSIFLYLSSYPSLFFSLTHLSSSLCPPESGDVPQSRGRLGDPWRSQNDRGATQTGEEAPGRRLLTGREGKIPAHPEPLLQGRHPPTGRGSSAPPGPPHPGPLQYSTLRSNAGVGWWQRRRRNKGEM